MSPIAANMILVLACLLWGSGNVAQKTILDHMGPFMATGLTCLLGSLCLLPIARREGRNGKAAGKPGLFELLGTVMFFSAAVTAYQIGYLGTSVSNAGFLVNTCTVLTPLAAWLLMREPPSFAFAPAILLVLLGVWLMGGASFTALAWGDVVCLVSASFFAVSVPLVSRHVLLYGRPAQLTCLQFLCCGLLCLVIALIWEPVDLALIAAAWPEILMLGIVSKGLAYFLMAYAQQHTSASAASITASGEAVFGAAFAFVLLGERMSGTVLTGAALILSSIVLLNMLPQRWNRKQMIAVLRRGQTPVV